MEATDVKYTPVLDRLRAHSDHLKENLTSSFGFSAPSAKRGHSQTGESHRLKELGNR
jgi:hypothetical protein